MSLDELKKILPIPSAPIDVEEAVLAQNIEKLGVVFPSDYIEYSKTYGSGTIVVGNDETGDAYDWEIYSAFRPSLPEIATFFSERYEANKDPEDEFSQIPLYPEPGGLLPFGSRDTFYFAWKTDGNPDDWKVVMFWGWDQGIQDDKGHQEFHLSFTEFLLQMLSRKIQMVGYREWSEETAIRFDPEVYGG